MRLRATVRTSIIAALQTLPGIETTQGRRALIAAVSPGEALQAKITFEGPTSDFCALLVETLDRYGTLPDGRDALAAVLETAKLSVGLAQHRDWLLTLFTALEGENQGAILEQLQAARDAWPE